MVGVPSLGAGAGAIRNGARLPVGDISDSSAYFEDFALSEIIIFISVVSIVLTALSCVGCLVFHCCPSWIPSKIRRSKTKEKYKKHCATLTIPVVIVSDDTGFTGIVDPPLYQANSLSDESNKDFEELTITIPNSSTTTEKLM